MLSRRHRFVKKIGRFKKEKGIPVVDRNRENEVMAVIEHMAGNKETGNYIKSIYRAVFNASYSVEKRR